jgi:hypothetical protein
VNSRLQCDFVFVAEGPDTIRQLSVCGNVSCDMLNLMPNLTSVLQSTYRSDSRFLDIFLESHTKRDRFIKFGFIFYVFLMRN